MLLNKETKTIRAFDNYSNNKYSTNNYKYYKWFIVIWFLRIPHEYE